jgi:hypothetical protein
MIKNHFNLIKRFTKSILTLIIPAAAIFNLSCSDMYSDMLDNMPENYRLSLFVNSPASNKIFINNENGIFHEAPGIFPDDGINKSAVVLADFNGDGKLDILAGEFSGNIKTYISTGKYFIAGPSVTITGGYQIRDMAVADFDNDKYPEVIVVTNGPHFLLQIDKSFFITDSNISGSSYNSSSVSSGDIDNDGDIDFYVGNRLENNTVWLNNGQGSFTNVWNDGNLYNTEDVVLADLDGNGTLDVIEANENHGITVRANTGNGSFNIYNNYISSSNDYSSISAGDIDSDGDFGVYITKNTSVSPNLILINNGNTSFTLKDSPSPIQISSASAMGDIDLDGDIDIIEANDSGLIFLKNDGSGNFSATLLPSGTVNNVKMGVLIK